jgi:hypothetical protein
MVDILKEAVSLGEGGTAVLDKVERTKLTKRRQKLLHLVKRGGKGQKKSHQLLS